MQSRLFYLTAVLVLLVVSQARSQSGDSTCNFTLQVGSFPDLASAEKFISKLKHDGEQPAWGTVDLPGRGKWTRVFMGAFQTIEAARRYGNDLVKRAIVPDFLVKT